MAKLEGSFRSSNTEREVRKIENSSKNYIQLLLVVRPCQQSVVSAF